MQQERGNLRSLASRKESIGKMILSCTSEVVSGFEKKGEKRRTLKSENCWSSDPAEEE